MFCDDFNDGVKSVNWMYLKGMWNETGGELVGSHTGKADAIADPVFVGCAFCTVEAVVELGSEPDLKVSVIGWYQDKKNYVEVLLVPGSGKVQFKQRANGTVVAKAKKDFTLNPNTSYDVEIVYLSSNFQVLVNGNLLLDLPAGAFPDGTVGFRVKKGTGRLDQIMVN